MWHTGKQLEKVFQGAESDQLLNAATKSSKMRPEN